MFETVAITIIFTWLFKGYKWREIFNLFKHWSLYPIVLTGIVQVYFVYSIIHSEYWFLEYANYIKITSLLFYLLLVWKYKLIDVSIFKSINLKENKQLSVWLTSPFSVGGLCTIIGSILNQIAMFYNENRMPVFVSNSWATGYAKSDIFTNTAKYGDFHIMGNEFTRLIPICDTWDFGFCTMSIGDIFIRIFVVLIIYYSIKRCNELKIIIDKPTN